MISASTSNQALAAGVYFDLEHGLHVEIPAEVQQALDSGVTLTFHVDTAQEHRFLFLSWVTKRQRQTLRVKYHALSKHYLIFGIEGRAPRSYGNVRQVNDFIAQFAQQVMAQRKQNDASESTRIAFRVQLDIFQLPTPMRLNAFWSSAWDIDSGWQQWL